MAQDIRLPDIGDFKDVPVIEILVSPGQAVKKEATLLTLESDKATLDVPAPEDGVIGEILVKVGDRVSQGSLLATYASAGAPAAATPAPAAAPQPAPAPADFETDLLVLGAGPGGYTAAFRAADLGQRVVLVDRRPELGGVCLNVGCIPSKALLHVAKTIDEASAMAAHGVSFGAPSIELAGVRKWKDGVVKRLTTGLTGLSRQRKVTVVRGEGVFTSPNTVRVETAEGTRVVRFAKAIIAAGSEPVAPGFIPADPRIWDSTAALELRFIPKRMLVLGGGIIGLEMATVYRALGAGITVIEMMDQLMPGADPDIVAPLAKRLGKTDTILLKTKVTAVRAEPEALVVAYEGEGGANTELFDAILVSVGRRPSGKLIGAEAAGVAADERGFVAVDREMRTNVHHIFAIGDIVGQPMLAHKASHEAKVAAEVASGQKAAFDARAIPSVAYTDPEVAWVGVTETEAKAKDLKFGKAVFPWAASGRSLSLGRDEGLTKTLWDEETGRLIGCGIVGPNAGDLISEAALAIEMGCEAEDIGLAIHPHPTLSETFAMSAEAFAGTLTDLYMPKKKA